MVKNTKNARPGVQSMAPTMVAGAGRGRSGPRPRRGHARSAARLPRGSTYQCERIDECLRMFEARFSVCKGVRASVIVSANVFDTCK